jgi:hypothetical protein
MARDLAAISQTPVRDGSQCFSRPHPRLTSANTAMRYGRVKSPLALDSLLHLSLTADAGCLCSDASGVDGMAVAHRADGRAGWSAPARLTWGPVAVYGGACGASELPYAGRGRRAQASRLAEGRSYRQGCQRPHSD